MLHNVRKMLSLPACDRQVLAQAWILLLVVDLGLRLFPFQQVVKWLRWGERFAVQTKSYDEAAQVRRLSRLVKVAGSHHLYAMTCLRQALVLRQLLSMKKIESELKIGVRLEAGALDAHAWLEYQGRPVDQPNSMAKNFAPLVLPEAGI